MVTGSGGRNRTSGWAWSRTPADTVSAAGPLHRAVDAVGGGVGQHDGAAPPAVGPGLALGQQDRGGALVAHAAAPRQVAAGRDGERCRGSSPETVTSTDAPALRPVLGVTDSSACGSVGPSGSKSSSAGSGSRSAPP